MKTIRIGNGQGFWGDNVDAPVELLRGGPIDYIGMDYLAEVTLSIMMRQKLKDPRLGYATDFIGFIRRVLREARERNVRILANAGGLNPRACRAKIFEVAREFGWGEEDWNHLAAGTIAGHVIECGAQCTGGNFSRWWEVPDLWNVGYPVVEARADGTFTVTKHPGTGGMVTVDTVAEQLLYEMGDPAGYITPDVIA